jgi:hypothetical protein
MPEGITVRFTIGRAVDTDQEIHLEGIGAVPSIDVPVDEVTAFSEGDVVLDYAVRALDEATGVVGPAELIITDLGDISIGDQVESSLTVAERVRYVLTADADATLTIAVEGVDGDLDTYLRVYDGEETLLAENDDVVLGEQINSTIEGVEVVEGDVLIIEVGTYDDASEGTFVVSVSAE